MTGNKPSANAGAAKGSSGNGAVSAAPSQATRRKSLQELLVDRANEDQRAIATAIIELVKEGDPSALKTLQQALEKVAYQDESYKFPVDDERFREIIIICAKRFLGELASV